MQVIFTFLVRTLSCHYNLFVIMNQPVSWWLNKIAFPGSPPVKMWACRAGHYICNLCVLKLTNIVDKIYITYSNESSLYFPERLTGSKLLQGNNEVPWVELYTLTDTVNNGHRLVEFVQACHIVIRFLTS